MLEISAILDWLYDDPKVSLNFIPLTRAVIDVVDLNNYSQPKS